MPTLGHDPGSVGLESGSCRVLCQGSTGHADVNGVHCQAIGTTLSLPQQVRRRLLQGRWDVLALLLPPGYHGILLLPAGTDALDSCLDGELCPGEGMTGGCRLSWGR